jgi:Fe2+ transport system protein FeoA
MATSLFADKEAVAEEIPVSRLLNGESGIFKTYTGERAMLGRLISLGFTPDSSVRMIENFRSGPILVKIHDVEIALDREMAAKIIVTRNNPGC